MSPLVKEKIKVGSEPARTRTEREAKYYHPGGAQLRQGLRRGDLQIVDPLDHTQVTAKQLVHLAEEHPKEFAQAAVERGLEDQLGPSAREELGLETEAVAEESRFGGLSDQKLRMLADVYDVAIPPRATRDQIITNLEAALGEQEAEGETVFTQQDLEEKYKAELAAIAVVRDLEVPPNATKAQLVELILSAQEGDEPLTREELEGMEKPELAAIAAEWELEIPPAATKEQLVDLIWDAYQGEGEADDGE